MNRMCFSLLLGGFLCAGVPAGAQEHIAREYIEWSDVWLTGAKLIWATITPVRQGEGMKEFAPITERMKARNAIALEYVKGQGIEVDDLWGVVADHPEYYAGGDGTHPVDAGFDALARQVAKVVGAALEGLE